MRTTNNRKNKSIEVKKEKGAALVTVVMLLLLMLAVSGALIFVTVSSTTSTVDRVAENQAYEAAEAGMQLALNVLRGNSPGTALSFKDAAVRVTSNKPDDWSPNPRLSNWLTYTYPTAQPDRVPLTSPYDPYTGLAYSVEVSAPDVNPIIIPTPNPAWIDGPVVKPSPQVKPPNPAWHPWHCAHCSWDYTHCSLYNPPNNGTLRADGYGCRHKHCIPPSGWGLPSGGGYERLVVRVTGYGPRGARQQLELMVNRTMFDYDPESLLYLRSAASGGLSFSIAGTPKVTFDSGDEIAFGVTTLSDETTLQGIIAAPDKITIVGKGDDFETFGSDEIPAWLKTTDDARRLQSSLELDARLRSRYFTSYPASGNGTDTVPVYTYINGDATITNDGVGILVVTGSLNISTDRKYKGLILLLGGGTLNITAGKSTIEGNIVVARYGATGDFLAPVINTSGTAEVIFKHNEAKVDAVMALQNMSVQAVREN